MRYGVMDVEQVERVELGHFGHAGGEREIVRWMLEERVAEYVDFVEVDVGLAATEAERRRRGDEVDFVAAGGEFDAELGGDDSASAISWVAGDADLAFGSHGSEWAGICVCHVRCYRISGDSVRMVRTKTGSRFPAGMKSKGARRWGVSGEAGAVERAAVGVTAGDIIITSRCALP